MTMKEMKKETKEKETKEKETKEKETKEKESNKGAAFAFFMEKYAPEANWEGFELVAGSCLHKRDHPDLDLHNLSPEQEELLINQFRKISKDDLFELIAGLLLSDYFKKETEKLRQRVEARKKQREEEK